MYPKGKRPPSEALVNSCFWVLLMAFTTLAYAQTPATPTAIADRQQPTHVQNRIAYGPTPEATAHIKANGVKDWIDKNLNEQFADPTRLQNLLSLLNLPTYNHQTEANSRTEIEKLQVARALYARNQLTEQMTNFWEQHFSTQNNKIRSYFRNFEGTGNTKDDYVANYFDWLENDDFRTLALGQFVDLLVTSATGPAMMAYLDTARSQATNPNENYGRELLELHTVGVVNHTEQDVDEAAKLFTGLEIEKVPPAQYGNALGTTIVTTADARGYGDVDDDGMVDNEDLNLVLAAIGGPYDPTLDVNGDGVIDTLDSGIILANWGMITWVFSLYYDENDYVPGEKVIFAGEPHEIRIGTPAGLIPTRADKYQETIDFLTELSRLSLTARYVSAKLIVKFVSPQDVDDLGSWPADLTALLDDCVLDWRNSSGNIGQVLATIFSSNVFLRNTYRFSKTETAFESTVSTVRAFELENLSIGAVTTSNQVENLRSTIQNKAFHSFFNVGPPTGFPEERAPGTGNMLAIMKRNEDNFTSGGAFAFDWNTLIPPKGGAINLVFIRTEVLKLLYGPGGTTANDNALADEFLSAYFATNPTATHADLCAELAAFASSYPQGFIQ